MDPTPTETTETTSPLSTETAVTTPPDLLSKPVEYHEVKVNGQVLKVPFDELKNGYQRQQDYTKKTMEYADARKAWDAKEAGWNTERGELEKFFADPRVQKFVQSLQAGITDPSQPLTMDQMQKLMEAREAKLQKEFETKLNSKSEEQEVNRLTNEFSREINLTLKNVIDKFPTLQDVEGIDIILKRAVANSQPKSLEEAKDTLVRVAEAQHNKIMGRFQTQSKEQLLNKEKLTKGGIEPPGGGAPNSIKPTQFKLGTKELFEAALDDYTKGSART